MTDELIKRAEECLELAANTAKPMGIGSLTNEHYFASVIQDLLTALKGKGWMPTCNCHNVKNQVCDKCQYSDYKEPTRIEDSVEQALTKEENPQLTAANTLVDKLEKGINKIISSEGLSLLTHPPKNTQTYEAKQLLAEIQQFKQGGK